ncbi:hypothetical protein M1O18_05180 [Dehalococcoidia bacterium]|nr:hypothetical protein [Dehalococcoidia bacterium]
MSKVKASMALLLTALLVVSVLAMDCRKGRKKVDRKPRLIEKSSSNGPEEQGCCFRTCGGKPIILQYSSTENSKLTKKLLEKISD